MSTITFLGCSGGCGTTTLAALTVAILADERAAMPALTAENPTAFAQRLGSVPPLGPRPGAALHDGGRFSTQKAGAALAQGTLILVGADTDSGVAALERASTAITTAFGADGGSRTFPIIVAAFGAPLTAGRTRSSAVHIPFDRALAPGRPIFEVIDEVRPHTREHLRRQLLPLLRQTYEGR